MDFSTRYKTFSTPRLIRITLEPEAYQPEAVAAARAELQRRGTATDEVARSQVQWQREQAVEHQKRDRWWEHRDRFVGVLAKLTNALSPVQGQGERSVATKVTAIAALLALMFIGRLVRDFAMVTILLESLPYFLLDSIVALSELIVTPVAIIFFLRYRAAGWVLVFAIAALNLAHVLAAIYWGVDYYYVFGDEYVDYSGEGDLLDLLAITAPEHPLVYLPALLLYASVAWLVSRSDMRAAYGVGPILRSVTYASAAALGVVLLLYLV